MCGKRISLPWMESGTLPKRKLEMFLPEDLSICEMRDKNCQNKKQIVSKYAMFLGWSDGNYNDINILHKFMVGTKTALS